MYLYGLSLSNLIRIIHRLYIILLQLHNALALLNVWKLRLSIHWESTCNSRACNTIEEACSIKGFVVLGCVCGKILANYIIKGLNAIEPPTPREECLDETFKSLIIRCLKFKINNIFTTTLW